MDISDTKFYKWVYFTVFKMPKRPNSATWQGWGKFEKELKEKHPWGYFVTHKIIKGLWWRLVGYPIKRWQDSVWAVKNRFLYKPWMLDSKLNRWEYHEVEDTLLHCTFEALVDFIEVQKANMYGDPEGTPKEKCIAKKETPWWKLYLRGRNPKAGLAYLHWECELDKETEERQKSDLVPHQAISAREQLALYSWWKVARPARPESSLDAAGWDDFQRRMDEKYAERGADPLWMSLHGSSKMTAAERDEQRAIYERSHEIDEAWAQEDEDMLIRLIKIRRHFWT